MKKPSISRLALLGLAMLPPGLSILRAQEAAPAVALAPLYPNLQIERPVSLQISPDGTGRRFLVQQTGKIRVLPADENAAEAPTFLDLSDRAMAEKDFEEGLLALAFHRDFKNNRRFYVTYSQQGPKRLRLSEFQASSTDPGAADPASERVLLEIQQPEWNHNSGILVMGPKDGFLYMCVGDGGVRDGVHLLSQRLQAWNGKVLRLDIDGRSPGREYGIPADNPFVDTPFACPEIWALGLRNPWGGAIDPETGVFYLADVGQDLWEEIDVIEKGGNYGWNHREGLHDLPFRPLLFELLKQKDKIPPGTVFVDPIHEYSHADGLSITGGCVYRGAKLPALAGHFLYGDWKYGTLWALKYDAEAKKVVANHKLLAAADPTQPEVQPTGFYPDENGEPIVLDWRGGLFRMVAK
ncbi:MAG: PQQ-dependent sugar dehydrogenase [Verrucomicrobiae bacterium]|nr:PQQ-dependent sugar dehydrogenase [Verrucomicrobiae bacterium]MCP5549302.1 PQQ-dependent sugar dehydrogenase [Akkermansiaceae bacterium]